MLSRLTVNMSNGIITKEPFALASSLGGRGLVSHILTTEIDPALDPLSPDNMLIYAQGSLREQLFLQQGVSP